jgi:hypothetical protein
LAIFLVAEFYPGNKKLWSQIARISPHSSQEIRVKQGRTIRIIGGNTGIEYMNIECLYTDFITIYRTSQLQPLPKN